MVRANFGYSFREAFSHFGRNLSTSLGAVVTIFLSLFIIGLFVIGSALINSVVGSVEQQVVINVYIDDAAQKADVTAFQTKIQKWDNVKSVTYKSKDQALKDYKDGISANASSMVDAMDGKNPLPASFVVEMNEPSSVESTANKIVNDDGFKKIADQQNKDGKAIQYGQKEVERLFTVTNYIRIAAIALVALLTFIAFVFINNTIRLSITARRREIAIMRLVGASNGFIRRPFMVEGVLQAVLGAVLAILSLELFRNLLMPRVQNSISFLSLEMPVRYYLLTYLLITAVGVVIGLVGSAIAMRRYLKV